MHAALSDLQQYHRQATQWRRAYPRELPWHKLLGWFGSWRRALPRNSDVRQSELPWMSFSAIDFLQRNLRPHHRVFEWRTGDSTPFLARRVRHLVSVEHDRQWFDRLKGHMHELGLRNWTAIYVAAQPRDAGQRDPADWTCYTTNAASLRGHCFRDYVHAIEQNPDEAFDFVIVDGRARPSCFVHALNKVRTGGYVLWDDTDRKYYWPVMQHAATCGLPSIQLPGPRPHTDFFTLATVWQRTDESRLDLLRCRHVRPAVQGFPPHRAPQSHLLRFPSA